MKYKKWLQKEPFEFPIPLYKDGVGKKRKFLPFFVQKMEEKRGLRVRIIEPAVRKKEKSGRWMVTARNKFSN